MEKGQFGTIYLFPEGTFYRAYEWSAWLCCRFINQFKATRREVKGELGETVVFIGFPITSLGKFLPEEAQMVANEDKSVSITLAMEMFQGADDTALRQSFEEWKSGIPLVAPYKIKEREKCGIGSPIGFFWHSVKDNHRRVQGSSCLLQATAMGLRSTMWAAAAATGRPRTTIATTRTT